MKNRLNTSDIALIRIIFVVLLFVLISCIHQQHSGSDQNPPGYYPYILNNAWTQCVDTTWIMTGMSNSIPPSIIEVIDSLIYRVSVRLVKASETGEWETPFYVACQTPDRRILQFVCYAEFKIDPDENLPELSFEVTIKHKGRGKVWLYFPELDTPDFAKLINENPFRSKMLTFY